MSLFFVESLLENQLDRRHRGSCIWSINLHFKLTAMGRAEHHQLDDAARINFLFAIANHNGRLKLFGYLRQY